MAGIINTIPIFWGGGGEHVPTLWHRYECFITSLWYWRLMVFEVLLTTHVVVR